MEVVKLLLNSHYGNKGIVFALDALVAIFLVVAVLLSSFLLITRSEAESYGLLQQMKLGNDLFASLDMNGKLDSLNKNTIITNIENILPNNFNYYFRLECENKIIQTNRSVGGSLMEGERIMITNNLDYCIARYSVWPK